MNSDGAGNMLHFWTHRHWRKTDDCEVLVLVQKSCVPSWHPLTRGERVPGTAVPAADKFCGSSVSDDSVAEIPGMPGILLEKFGVASKHGTLHVGRFNGEAGSIQSENGFMTSFWGHYWTKQYAAEVLTLLRRKKEEEEQPEGKIVMKVLQFNIWQEGWEVRNGLEKIADIIWASKADVVALSEVRNWSGRGIVYPYNDFHVRLCAVLNARAAKCKSETIFHGSWVQDCDTGLVSRWPIELAENVTHAQRSFIAAYHLTTPAGPLLVCSAHLDWKKYALNLVRGYDADTFKKMPEPTVNIKALHDMDDQSGRGEALLDFLEYASKFNKPTILAGDFNECSHLDWTEATKDMYGHGGVAIEWKHSLLLREAGFEDSWRAIHPDPVTHMGATWPSQADGIACTSWATESDERDRIDFVYHNGMGLKALEAYIVGPKGYFIKGKPADSTCQSPFLAETETLPWPSDHKGVQIVFEFSGTV